MDRQILNKIKKEVEEFFQKMTFEVEVELAPENDQTVPVNVKAEDPQVLIGEGGQTLNDIQHLLKIILKRKMPETLFFIDIDISDYKKKKNEYLRELARDTANEVALVKTEKTLPAMSAYDRRVIHMELANRSDVMTESSGEEPERRIIIKPAS